MIAEAKPVVVMINSFHLPHVLQFSVIRSCNTDTNSRGVVLTVELKFKLPPPVRPKGLKWVGVCFCSYATHRVIYGWTVGIRYYYI